MNNITDEEVNEISDRITSELTWLINKMEANRHCETAGDLVDALGADFAKAMAVVYINQGENEEEEWALVKQAINRVLNKVVEEAAK